MRKHLFSFIIIAFLLGLGLAIVLNGVSAQVACQENATCSRLGPEFRCISDRCNLLPPIWNVLGTGLQETGQNAMIFLKGDEEANSARFGNLQIGMGNQINNLRGGEVAINWMVANKPRIGRGFTVYDGNEGTWFRVNREGIVTITRGLNVGATATDAGDGEIRASGAIRAPRFCIGNDCIAVWPAGGVGGAGGACAIIFRTVSGSLDGDRDGYGGANSACDSALGGSHVCTNSEILNSIICGASLPSSGTGWIFNGAPGYTSPAVNDCNGWQSNSGTVYGAFWSFTSNRGFATSCNIPRPFACCR